MNRKRARKTVIECRKIVKSFGEGDLKVKILKSVDLKVGEGEFMMLVWI